MRLSTREITVVIGGGAALLIMAIWFFAIEPMNEKLAVLDRQLEYYGENLEGIQKLAGRFEDLKTRITSTEARLKRSRDFSTLSHMENQAQRLNVKKHIVQMKPKSGQSTRFYKESVVEIKMEKIPLNLLVRYLYQVENSPELLRIKQLKLKPRFDNPDLMDATFQVSAYELSESS